MQSAVTSVLNDSSITNFTIDVQITNTNDATYQYAPMYIDKITIEQNYADNFADEIFLEFKVSPADYIQLYNNNKSLNVSLRFVYVDPVTLMRVFNPAPIARSYKALLMNPVDLLKKYTPGKLMPTSRTALTEAKVGLQIPVKLWLIEATTYQLRQQQFNAIISKRTVGDTIRYIANRFQIKQLYLVPPDNKMTWEHIVIPPAQNFDEIFAYLQYTYGIYMKGIDWYYTNSTLYVYPAYENNPAINYVANIYHVDKMSYAGLHSYHSIIAANLINIVSANEVNTTDISRPTAEESGNSFSFLRASSVIDNSTTTNAQGTFVNNNNALTVGTTLDRMTTNNALNPKYTKATNNIFYENSKLAELNAVLIECAWSQAVPFQLVPGHNIKYHFDKNGVFTNQQGILESAVYVFGPIQKLGTGYTYGGVARLHIRADSDVTD